MSSNSQRRGKHSVYDPHAAAKERKAEYMREYRARRDVRERPETRVLDRSIVAALALVLATIDERDAETLRRVVASRATDGLIREGYDAKGCMTALLARLDELGDGTTSSSVREAFEARRWGQSARGRRVRHEDALVTPS